MFQTASTDVKLASLAATAAAANATAGDALPDMAAAGLMLAGRTLYMAGKMTVIGKQYMLPGVCSTDGLPIWQSLPWAATGCDVLQDGLDVLLPQLKLPGEPAAAQAAVVQLQEQYKQFKETLMQHRTALPTGVVLGLISDVDSVAADQLLSFGTALCTQLPMPWCCNNIECLNLSCESEQKLVGGKECVCAGCRPRRARYCGPECQKQHWKQHKPVCKTLR